MIFVFLHPAFLQFIARRVCRTWDQVIDTVMCEIFPLHRLTIQVTYKRRSTDGVRIKVLRTLHFRCAGYDEDGTPVFVPERSDNEKAAVVKPRWPQRDFVDMLFVWDGVTFKKEPTPEILPVRLMPEVQPPPAPESVSDFRNLPLFLLDERSTTKAYGRIPLESLLIWQKRRTIVMSQSPALMSSAQIKEYHARIAWEEKKARLLRAVQETANVRTMASVVGVTIMGALLGKSFVQG
ncbi:hypothetical protein DFJ77DRAFT_548030 [Powellomyces hirtus]|nr:hypothetical protein DFJ77DRAFT_548030 [Powellomyces hirtus]